MVDTLLPGITAHLLTTPRYTAQVLERPVPRVPVPGAAETAEPAGVECGELAGIEA